jgi:hypothetical protein
MPFPSFDSGMLSSLNISSGTATAGKDSPANDQFPTISATPHPPQIPAQVASAGKTSQSPQIPAFNYGDVAVYTQSGKFNDWQIFLTILRFLAF